MFLTEHLDQLDMDQNPSAWCLFTPQKKQSIIGFDRFWSILSWWKPQFLVKSSIYWPVLLTNRLPILMTNIGILLGVIISNNISD